MPDLTVAERLGIAGFFLGLLNLFLQIARYWMDRGREERDIAKDQRDARKTERDARLTLESEFKEAFNRHIGTATRVNVASDFHARGLPIDRLETLIRDIFSAHAGYVGLAEEKTEKVIAKVREQASSGG